MKNKKGFTLIELLAVIIILGVLMIIAIPSVTEYISSSRKSAFVDTASGYIDSVRTKVNQGTSLQFYDVNKLYLVPVGNDAAVSCVSVESGGKSPFSDYWAFAYVGVTYNGTGYNYYFIGKDGSGQGINFVSDDALAKYGADLVVSGNLQLANYAQLADTYGTYDETNDKYTAGSGARYAGSPVSGTATGYSTTAWAEPTNSGDLTQYYNTDTAKTYAKDKDGLVKYVEDAESGTVAKHIYEIEVVGVNNCK